MPVLGFYPNLLQSERTVQINRLNSAATTKLPGPPLNVQPMLWVFSLGTVKLARFEVPGSFKIGHEGHVAVHKFISETGEFTIKAQGLGAFPLPTTWKGLLVGSNAIQRMDQLDFLCAQQQLITWQYGPRAYTVVVDRFEATVLNQINVEYDISLVVVNDRNGISSGIDRSSTFDATVDSSYSIATQSVVQIQQLDPSVPADLIDANNALNITISQSYPLKTQPFSVITGIINLIGAVIDQLNVYIGPLKNAAVLENDLAKLNASLAALVNFGLLQTNLQLLVGSGIGSPVVKSVTGNLFAVAAQYYPQSDIDDAVSLLMVANKINDPFIYTPIDLKIPPLFI